MFLAFTLLLPGGNDVIVVNLNPNWGTDICEPVLGDSNDHITHILPHSGSYLKDNRIPPEGFTNGQFDTIEAQTRTVDVDNDTDFNIANIQGAVEAIRSSTAFRSTTLIPLTAWKPACCIKL